MSREKAAFNYDFELVFPLNKFKNSYSGADAGTGFIPSVSIFIVTLRKNVP